MASNIKLIKIVTISIIVAGFEICRDSDSSSKHLATVKILVTVKQQNNYTFNVRQK